MSFQLGTFKVQTLAGFDLSQTYEGLGGEGILRTYSGRGIKQATYDKLRVRTSGTGWIPAGLRSLDFNAQHILRCVTARAVPATFATRQATLPSGRRSDAGFTAYGLAFAANGNAVKCGVTMAGEVATVAAVEEAVDYAVCYYPELTVWAMRPAESADHGQAIHRWEIVCEEV